MSDRSSAEIFGNVFRLLNNRGILNPDIAQEIYEMLDYYDFSDVQMGDDVYGMLVDNGIIEDEREHDYRDRPIDEDFSTSIY